MFWPGGCKVLFFSKSELYSSLKNIYYFIALTHNVVHIQSTNIKCWVDIVFTYKKIITENKYLYTRKINKPK